MEVTPLRRHPPEGSSKQTEAKRDATPKRGVASPSSVEILDGAGETGKTLAPESSRSRARENAGNVCTNLLFCR